MPASSVLNLVGLGICNSRTKSEQHFATPGDGVCLASRFTDLVEIKGWTDLGAEHALADQRCDFAKQKQSRGDGAVPHPVAKPESLDDLAARDQVAGIELD